MGGSGTERRGGVHSKTYTHQLSDDVLRSQEPEERRKRWGEERSCRRIGDTSFPRHWPVTCRYVLNHSSLQFRSGFFTSTYRDHNDYEGRAAQDGHLDFHTAPELWMDCSFVQCCFTSTETIRTIGDGEPRTATSTFTQLLGSALNYLQGTQAIAV